MKKFSVFSSLGVLSVWLFPISNYYTRLIFVFLIVGSALSILIAAWPHTRLRIGILIILLFIVAIIILPGRATDQAALSTAFVRELQSYEGTKYVWGGEGRLGIDCSGLIRSAFVGAALKHGVVTMNPELIRLALSVWWHDATARQFGKGYRNLTNFVTTAGSINTIEPSLLRLGDLAVTTSGIHILGFVGNGKWVEADPDLGKVVVLSVPQPTNRWFNMPIHIVRLTPLIL
ncbi:NLPC_P60 domain-containing protein [Gammaproteobacteria bacterium]